MTIDEVYQFVNFQANKNQSGNITPQQFSLAAFRAQQEFINKEYRLWQNTREVTDALSPFLMPVVLSPNTDGQIFYPADYMHIVSLRALYFKNNVAIPVEVREVSDDDAGDVFMSPIVNPTLKYPVINYYDSYIQIYPKNVASIQFTYFRYPAQPVWAYTMVSGRPIYDPSNSVQFEVRSEFLNEVAEMICSYFSIFLRDQSLTQYAEMQKAQKT